MNGKNHLESMVCGFFCNLRGGARKLQKNEYMILESVIAI
jgi:hypothetical protein